MECPHCGTRNQDTHRLFCSGCGKLKERQALRSVNLCGFTGGASLNPNVERFWETGDPSVFD